MEKNVPRVLSVICFGKYLSTDIFYFLCFQSRNICQQIFQNGYFSLLYVICLQRLQKTEKLATENRYSKKKRWCVSHCPGMTQTVHPKLEKNYTFSVFCRTKTQPKNYDRHQKKISHRMAPPPTTEAPHHHLSLSLLRLWPPHLSLCPSPAIVVGAIKKGKLSSSSSLLLSCSNPLLTLPLSLLPSCCRRY